MYLFRKGLLVQSCGCGKVPVIYATQLIRAPQVRYHHARHIPLIRQEDHIVTRVIMRRRLLAFVAVLCLPMVCGTGKAADLPKAAVSPIAGITFDDPPISLPVAPNFQVAMQAAAGELGLSCGTVESYGWRMQQSEQQRVNTIFTTTVERLRAQNFIMETRAPTTVAHDITVFTAHRRDKDLLAMWSAGELGLVLLLCDAQSLAAPVGANTTFMPPADAGNPTAQNDDFTPVGAWEGTFFCARGVSGGRLDINAVDGTQIEGSFNFYATRRNAKIPNGSYAVTGSYDPASKRVQLNPGAWIDHPAGFTAVPLIGSFDPAHKTFNAVFQGVAGCTSFEANQTTRPHGKGARPKAAKAIKPLVKKTPHHAPAKPKHVMREIIVAPTPKADEAASSLPAVVAEPPIEKLTPVTVPAAIPVMPPPLPIAAPVVHVPTANPSPANALLPPAVKSVPAVKPKVEAASIPLLPAIITLPRSDNPLLPPTPPAPPPRPPVPPTMPMDGSALPTPPDMLPDPPPIQPGVDPQKKSSPP